MSVLAGPNLFVGRLSHLSSSASHLRPLPVGRGGLGGSLLLSCWLVPDRFDVLRPLCSGLFIAGVASQLP
jgi:hypothetical protein